VADVIQGMAMAQLAPREADELLRVINGNNGNNGNNGI
jgi:hypothetical protein